MMPLSEQEQRLLEEMERSLYHNDAEFVATVSGRRSRPNYTMVVVGVLVIVLGIAALAAGVITKLAIIGILGFAVMIVGALLIFSPREAAAGASSPTAAPAPGRGGAKRPSSSSSFMDKINERWEKRQGGQD
ncbi:DUF3040 domain-containing protein [Clavibacter michiganensis]|uniref:DUF3040 domain-containing protein n=1 Tax=Clavibacter michiganensis TaxID=28447 RepID=UPI0009A6AFBD|nr:DUF3040 domain-containing protein [Clavibacter michiganensis]MBF4637128.1 DUF3040 domain-containing protein [Clavibacter michiganensis subsp. michiganensis]MDO4124331.1 DUF3040 domain-containing protein [Clavibacter michiganensis]MDO4139366.1 DUF3040 domain-containing protein [Clavibacter michiganensis]MWJ07773.1 DUF3040 domain-containing protein [Clavibacter michiganensis subsp. michiganensis]MWJ89537.1 DUF3040 domain-containing protein [Clavibacter michiganensis subsp. michiganensis]